jgi:hypothetical protein
MGCFVFQSNGEKHSRNSVEITNCKVRYKYIGAVVTGLQSISGIARFLKTNFLRNSIDETFNINKF